LPLALNDRLTSDWTEEDVDNYIRLLKEHSYFPEGIIPPELDEMYDAAYKFKNGLILKEELWLVLKLAEQRILGIEQ
jgi:hypothetical protein